MFPSLESATSICLPNTEYTLFQLVLDASGSACAYSQAMEHLIKDVVRSCSGFDRNNLLLRVSLVGTTAVELHGFRSINKCDPADYDDVVRYGGVSALYDAIIDAVEAVNDLSQRLTEFGCSTNGVVVVVTDGMEYGSVAWPAMVKKTLERMTVFGSRSLVLAGIVGVPVCKEAIESLHQFRDSIGFTGYLELDGLDANALMYLRDFVCRLVQPTTEA